MKPAHLHQIKSYLTVLLLAVAMSLNYELFVFPNAFAPAGINGLATMIQYVFHLRIGYFSLLINLPLILLAWKKLDPDFARKSLLFVLVFSTSSLVLNHLQVSRFAYHTVNGTSAILGPLAAGVISGIIYGIVIGENGSTGGTDILAAWVHKLHPHASLVWVIFTLNATVALLSFFVYGQEFEPVILCLIYCYLTSSVSDAILKNNRSILKIEIITPHAQALSAALTQELRHGVTALPARGMYTDTPRSLLICLVHQRQLSRFQEILSRFPDTFCYTTSVGGLYGKFAAAK